MHDNLYTHTGNINTVIYRIKKMSKNSNECIHA